MRETAKPSNEMPLTSLSPAPVPATAPAATAATSAAAAALAAAAAATATAAAASTAAGLSAGAHRELRVRRQPLCAAEGGSLAMEPRDSSRLARDAEGLIEFPLTSLAPAPVPATAPAAAAATSAAAASQWFAPDVFWNGRGFWSRAKVHAGHNRVEAERLAPRWHRQNVRETAMP